jgi:hypothetical protein
MTLQRGQVMFDKAVAGFFILFGALSILSAFATAFNSALVWWDTGRWQADTLRDVARIGGHHPSGLLWSVADVLLATPAFVVAVLLGVWFLRGGLWRWAGADLPENPIS